MPTKTITNGGFGNIIEALSPAQAFPDISGQAVLNDS